MSRRNRRGRRNNRSRRQKPSLLKRIFTNRRNANSSWISLADVLTNIREEWFVFEKRVPPGSRILWGKDGRPRGYSSTRRY